MAKPTTTMTPISIADRELAKRLTAELFKRHRPKGAKPGPGHAIHESLELMARCLDGRTIPVSGREHETLEKMVQNRHALSVVVRMLANWAAVLGAVTAQIMDKDETNRRIAELNHEQVETMAALISARALRQVAGGALEAEAQSEGREPIRSDGAC